MGQYHDHIRKELAPLLCHAPRCVLDVGCASGATSAWLKEQYPDLVTYGVELNAQAAALAEKRLNKVFVQPAEQVVQNQLIEAHSVDTVILADVLEHMENPWHLLESLHPVLAPDAQLLISLPNVRNLWLMDALANGSWTYQSEGLLDITHLRFFTLNEARRMLAQTGYEVARVDYVADQRIKMPSPPRYQQQLDGPKLVLKDVDLQEQQELSALQILICAVPKGSQTVLADERAADSSVLAHDVLRKQQIAHEKEYWRWRGGQTVQPYERQWMLAAQASWGERAPHLHLALMLLPGQEAMLKENIASLQAQIYDKWSMTIVAFSAMPDGVVLPRGVNWYEVGDEEDTVEVLNRLPEQTRADWLGLWDAGDMLDPDALFWLARGIVEHPVWRIAYSDEDVLDKALRCSRPHLKPDFNLDLLRSFPYVGGLCLFHRDTFSQLGGFTCDIDGAEEYDLTLRVFEHWNASAIGHVSRVSYHRREGSGHFCGSVDELWEQCRKALQRHLDRSVPGAVAHFAPSAPYLRVVYPLQTLPRVSIIIPTKDRPDLLKRCVGSLLERTEYANYELLIVDNNTQDREALAYMEVLQSDARVRVLRYPLPFNYSAENNLAAREATGDYLLLLNNDTEITDGDWLQAMLRYAVREDVGVVGPLLLLEDGTVQHAGVVMGLGYAPAEHIYIQESRHAQGHFGRQQLTQNYSAVTGACLLVRKQLYDAVGGLDETAFAINFNDVDLCLKIAAQGYRIVWTPDTSLVHIGSQSQSTVFDLAAEARAQRFKNETANMYRKWMPQIVHEAAWNGQFSRSVRMPLLENDVMLTHDPEWRPCKRILAHPGDKAGRGLYRIDIPSKALREAGRAMAWATDRIYGEYEIARLNPDAIILQEQTRAHQIEAIKRYKAYSNARIVFELDDLITELNPRNFPHLHGYDRDKTAKDLEQALRLSDRFVVTTPYLKEAYSHLSSDIRVVPNYLNRKVWGRLKSVRRSASKPRVGWAGGSSHIGDLEMIADVVRILANEVDWVFFGMCPDAIRPYVKEIYWGVPLGEYPMHLANLDLDLALAPLEVHEFNRGKSSLRLLEYGALGYPVICTDLEPYQGDFPVTRVSNSTDEWVAAIREAVSDRDALARNGNELFSYINRHYFVEDHLDVWLSAWTD